MHAFCINMYNTQAARGGHLLVMELLSQNGANLDALTTDDVAPLDIAMQLENQDMITLLVAKLEREQMARA
jgi:ankyrin repeat protein